jgi:hypothetical protein
MDFLLGNTKCGFCRPLASAIGGPPGQTSGSDF